MGDVIKDLMEAANARIRSPFVGSIIFVFLAVNWRPVFNLLFGDLPVLVRLAHFENKTDNWSLYFWPIGGGIVFALLSPWLKFVGAWVAKIPLARLRELQDEATHQHQMTGIRRGTELQERRAAEEEARERRKIDAAKREKEAEEVGGTELLEQFQDVGNFKSGELDDELSELSKHALTLLKNVAKTKAGDLVLVEDESGKFFASNESDTLEELSRKQFLAAEAAIAELRALRLFEATEHPGVFQITHKGYEASDRGIRIPM